MIMKKTRHNSGLWQYLSETGCLERGNENEIKQAKAEYRKLYNKTHKREKRRAGLEISICLTKDERLHLEREAKRHGQKLPTFIRQTSLSYIKQVYIVVDRKIVTHLQQMLFQCVQDIQIIAKQKHFFTSQSKFEQLEQVIERLNKEIMLALTKPKVAETKPLNDYGS